jgi:hypothetical protein
MTDKPLTEKDFQYPYYLDAERLVCYKERVISAKRLLKQKLKVLCNNHLNKQGITVEWEDIKPVIDACFQIPDGDKLVEVNK